MGSTPPMSRTRRLTLFAALSTAAVLVERKRRDRSPTSPSARPDSVHREASEGDVLDQQRIVGAAPSPERHSSDPEAPVEDAIDQARPPSGGVLPDPP